jgi:hypothetical protein
MSPHGTPRGGGRRHGSWGDENAQKSPDKSLEEEDQERINACAALISFIKKTNLGDWAAEFKSRRSDQDYAAHSTN